MKHEHDLWKFTVDDFDGNNSLAGSICSFFLLPSGLTIDLAEKVIKAKLGVEIFAHVSSLERTSYRGMVNASEKDGFAWVEGRLNHRGGTR